MLFKLLEGSENIEGVLDNEGVLDDEEFLENEGPWDDEQPREDGHGNDMAILLREVTLADTCLDKEVERDLILSCEREHEDNLSDSIGCSK